MAFFSTRGESCVIASQAVLRGLAPDGGLYVPAMFPAFTPEQMSSLYGKDYAGRAADVLKVYLEDYTSTEISEILAFSSQSYFIRCFRNAAGITPAEYRRRYYAKAMKAADGIPEQDGRDGEGADAWHPGSYPTNKRSDKQEGTL